MGKLMVDLQEVMIQGRNARLCPVDALLGVLPSEDRETLKEALASPVHATRIRAILKQNGYELSRDAIPEHRRGACACSTTKETR